MHWSYWHIAFSPAVTSTRFSSYIVNSSRSYPSSCDSSSPGHHRWDSLVLGICDRRQSLQSLRLFNMLNQTGLVLSGNCKLRHIKIKANNGHELVTNMQMVCLGSHLSWWVLSTRLLIYYSAYRGVLKLSYLYQKMLGKAKILPTFIKQGFRFTASDVFLLCAMTFQIWISHQLKNDCKREGLISLSCHRPNKCVTNCHCPSYLGHICIFHIHYFSCSHLLISWQDIYTPWWPGITLFQFCVFLSN